MHPIGVGGRNIHTAKIILPITGGSEAELQMTEYGLARYSLRPKPSRAQTAHHTGNS